MLRPWQSSPHANCHQSSYVESHLPLTTDFKSTFTPAFPNLSWVLPGGDQVSSQLLPLQTLMDLSEHSSLTLPASKTPGQVTAFLCLTHLSLCGFVTFWFLYPQFNTASGESVFEQKMTTEIASIRNPPPSVPFLLLAFPMLCMWGLLDQHSSRKVVSYCLHMNLHVFVIGSAWVYVSFQSTNAVPSRGHLLFVLLLNFRKLLLHGVFIPCLLTFCLFH